MKRAFSRMAIVAAFMLCMACIFAPSAFADGYKVYDEVTIQGQTEFASEPPVWNSTTGTAYCFKITGDNGTWIVKMEISVHGLYIVKGR